MSNLGYFQLKTAPGVWHLGLTPGRSQELYTISSSTGATSGERAEAVHAAPGALEVGGWGLAGVRCRLRHAAVTLSCCGLEVGGGPSISL